MFGRAKEKREELRHALRDALQADLPLGAADVPAEVPLTGWLHVGHALLLALILSSLTVYKIWLGLGIDRTTLVIVAGHLCLAAAAGLPDLSALDRRLHVSSQGIRVTRIQRTDSIDWPEIREIEAKEDLSSVRIQGSRRAIIVDCRLMGISRRKALITALRSRAEEAGIDIRSWPKREVRMAQIRLSLFAAGGFILILGGTILGIHGTALGIRCGANSTFMQKTFQTPDQQGCVVLRVSAGAEKAGIREGDLIVAVNDVRVTSGTQFTQVFREFRRRRNFEIAVVRSGEPGQLTFRVRYGPRSTQQEDPDDPIFYYLRARSRAGEEPIEAIHDYSRAIELSPELDLAYLYRAELYDKTGADEAASADFTKALALTPGLGELYRILGRHEAKRDITAAHFRVRKAIELDRCEGSFEGLNVDCTEDYFFLATLQVNSYDLNIPIETAKQAIAFWPGAPQPYYLLATLYERQGDTATAATYARQYLEFPAEDRYSENEADAKRIRDLVR